MSTRQAYERIVGGVVFVVGAAIVAYAFAGEGIVGEPGYPLFARFQQVDGIAPGSDVRVAGVSVGTVSGLAFDPGTRRAIVSMRLDETVKLPTDTAAAIVQNGILGNKYVRLDVGGSEEMLAPGDSIEFTQDAILLLDVLERVVSDVQARRRAK